MFIVGLTGGIGAGKSTVAREFANLGVDIIDTDVVARDILQMNPEVITKIQDKFPEAIADNGKLDRAKLRSIVFSNLSNKAWLEKLLHPLIRHETMHRIKEATSSYCIVVVPLLIETKFVELVDATLVVDIPQELQIERAMQRDGTDRKTIENIINAQVSHAERLKYATDLLDNTKELSELRHDIELLHKHYLHEANKTQRL